MTEKVLEWVRGVSLIDLDAGAGVEGFTCVGKELSKSDQSITTDLSDRVPSIVGINEMDYCTDQDTIKVTDREADGLFLPITTSATGADCASAFAADCAAKSVGEALWSRTSRSDGGCEDFGVMQ